MAAESGFRRRGGQVRRQTSILRPLCHEIDSKSSSQATCAFPSMQGHMETMRRIPYDPQKNSKVLFYLTGLGKMLSLSRGLTRQLEQRYHSATPDERREIRQRTDYYLKPGGSFELGPDSLSIRSFRHSRSNQAKSSYFFDLHEHLRHFEPDLRFLHRFGDNFRIPEQPTILKARALSDDNGNGVLMKLNKVRHFIFVKDDLTFDDKINRLVWRGNGKGASRRNLLDTHFHHPWCDVGHIGKGADDDRFRKPYLNLREQLRHRFILSIEGNDVATNLKWIMSSQSVCFMARPTRETWFMEGSLVPGHHYVALKDDHSDLEEKLAHYRDHPDECREIIRNANRHVERFRNPQIEALISLSVLEEYFRRSGQSPQRRLLAH
jgi:hypothetical protein